ncbi:MAG: phospholipid carrier-dependent glycosyltransferase [Candidatus Latescibacteria bacterium]|jgi:hypothetical protein|nr:phospholipid carrier-dependent glycosyltransferase [Candidatus Latescibacterota bacterium]
MTSKSYLARPDILLFTFCLSVYLLTMGGHLYSADNEIKGMIAEGIVERHSVSLPKTNMMYMTPGRDGLSYSYFALGSSLTMIPFYLIGDAASALAPQIPRSIILEFCYSFINSLVTALTCTVLFLICRSLGYGTKTAIVTSLIYGFATIAWPYAKTTWSEPQSLLCVLASFLCLLKFRSKDRWFWLSISGTLLGYGITTRSEMGLFLFVFSGFILFSLWHRNRRIANIAKAGLFYGIPLAFFGFINLYYNYLRFEDWLNFGQLNSVEQHLGQTSPFWDSVEGFLVGTYQHLFSTGKGLLVFSPPILLFYWAIKRFRVKHPQVALVCIAIPVMFFISAGTSWQMTFMAWGERYFVSLTPFLVLPLAALIEDLVTNVSSYMKRSVFVLTGIGFLVQLLGVTVNFQATSDRLLSEGDKFDVQMLSYDPEYSPILLNFKELITKIEQNGTAVNKDAYSASSVPGNLSGPPVANLDDLTTRQNIRFRTFDFWFSYMYASGIPLVIILLPVAAMLTVICLSSWKLVQACEQLP